MKQRILQNGRLTPASEQRLADEFDLCPLWQENDPAAFASSTRETFEAMENLVVENLHSFFKTGRVLTSVF